MIKLTIAGNRSRIVLVFMLLMLSGSALAQITGPGSQTTASAPNYECFNDGYYLFATPVWTLSPASAGTVQSVTVLPDHYTSRASIQWLQAGTVTVTCTYGSYFTETTTVVVTCASLPAVPSSVTISAPICGTSGAATLAAVPGAGGNNIKWYSVATGGTALANVLSYTTQTLSAPTNYYASSTSAGGTCESSSRASVEVAINPAVAVPTFKVDDTRCGPGTVAISATPASPATSIRWYTSDIGGDILATGATYSANLTAGNVNYYAASYNPLTGCASTARLAVTGTANDIPDAPATTGSYAFGSGNITLDATLNRFTKKSFGPFVFQDPTSHEVRWYSNGANADANLPVLATGNSYTTPLINTTATYYVRARNTVTGCLSEKAPAIAYIYPILPKQSVKTEIIRVSGKKQDIDLIGLTDSQKSVGITYIDGLGRVSQQVAIKASTDGKDIVQPVEYDVLGRVTKQYLPYADNTSETFRSGYQADQYNFYQNEAKVAHDAYPYSKSVYENSPLGRLVEQTNAGQAFQPGSGHTGQIVYGFNTGATASEAEEVRKFNPDGTSSGFYAANTLSRTETIDADGNKVITFTSPAGKTLAVKQQFNASQYLETYYIYDDLGQLKFTIQPEGVLKFKTNGWDFSTTTTPSFRDQYAFQYVYDTRRRVIETRVPGKGWTYTVYNQLNQPVLTQDQQLRETNQWMFMKYDRAGRVVITGLYTDATNPTRATLQQTMDQKTYTTEKYFETRNASGTHKYTNDAFPITGTEVHDVMYYDTYDFDSYATYTPASLVDEETQGPSAGKLTGSKTLILGTATWLKKFVYYDVQGRVIQVRSNNHLNATPDNLTSTSYDFEKVLQTKTYHNSGTPGVTEVLNTYEYYNQGSVKRVKQKNNSAAEQLVVQYEYNPLGQVVDKKLHGTGTPGSETFLQSVDYRYTLNGQLASINNATLDASTTANDETTDYFGMELLYNTTESNLSTSQRYNGMVSAIKWKGPGPTGSNGQRSYAFGYDKSGKLENAAYAVKNGSDWNHETGAQDEVMSYDRNGNIKTLTRKQRKHQLTGITGSYTNEQIDNLTYTYTGTNVNRLDVVNDAATTPAPGFTNGNTSGSDYGYDNSGNVTSDLNKGITSIVYNFLGKPTQVNFTGGKKIEYTYDAGGNKLTQKLYQGTTLQTTTHYANGFVYEAAGTGSPVLSFFGSPEGRVVKTGSTLTYEYSIADHQGNTRVVFTSSAPAITAPETNFEDNTAGFLNFPSGGTISTEEFFDHTDPGTTNKKSTRLNGGYNSHVGVAKTFKVYPGDKIKAEAFVKYEELPQNPVANSLAGYATMLTGAFWVSPPSGEALKAYNSLNSYGGAVAAGTAHTSDPDDPGAPKAFVTIIFFDKNYNYLDASWKQVAAGFDQDPSFINKDAFDHVIKEVVAKEEGYAYVFISNENPTFINVYFDDVKFTHTPSNVIQYNEYYPFGLQTSTSWTREYTKDNNYLYNAANELNKTSGWYEMFYRGYDPAIGRMLQVDPYATMYASHTTYNYAVNNPVMMNDPSGGEAQGQYAEFWNMLLEVTSSLAKEDGWNGFRWSRDDGFNLLSDDEANAFVEDYKNKFGNNMLLVQIDLENPLQKKEAYIKAVQNLRLYMEAKNVHVLARISFSSEIISRSDFFKKYSSQSIYVVAASEDELNQVTIDMEKGGWERLWGDTGGDFSGYGGVAATDDQNIIINLDWAEEVHIIQGSYRTFPNIPDDGYGNCSLGVTSRLTDMILHEVLHITYVESHQGQNGTILQSGPTYLNAPVTPAMINSLRAFFNSKP
jgi:RHS repeat-associated protein